MSLSIWHLSIYSNFRRVFVKFIDRYNSKVLAKIVALNIVHQIKSGNSVFKHKASMGKMGAACVVSAGFGMLKGNAATMTVYPIVPDWQKYPQWGRDLKYTVGEAGLAGHWIKIFLHYMFIHKAKGYPFWWLIPESNISVGILLIQVNFYTISKFIAESLFSEKRKPGSRPSLF